MTTTSFNFTLNSTHTSPVVIGLLVLTICLTTAEGSERDQVSQLPALSPGFQSRLGKVVSIYRIEPARFSFDSSAGRVRSAAEGAEEGARAMLHAVPERFLVPEPIAAAATVALAPLSAAAGALSARREVLNWTDLRAAEAELTAAASNFCAQARLHDAFLSVARARIRSAWPAALEPFAADSGRAEYGRLAGAGFDSALDLRLDELRLTRTGSGETSYALSMEGRARLIRTRDGMVLYDEPFWYRSGTGLFVDWTLNGGEAVQRVAERGYRRIAEQVAQQLFLSAFRPGRIESAVRTRPKTRVGGGVIEVMSPVLTPDMVASLGTVGIVSTSTIPTRVQIQRPLTKDQAVQLGRETARNVWAESDEQMDELLATPWVNAVVAGSVIPVSIVGQTIGAVRGLSDKKLQAAHTTLARAAGRVNLQEAMRRTIANRIESLTSHPIKLVAKPLPPGNEAECAQMSCFMAGTLAFVPEGQTPSGYLRSQGIGTALEIEVIRPALHGEGVINPPMGLSLTVRAKLIRMQDLEAFYSVSVKYRSQERKFADWATRDGKAFDEELERCVQLVSAAIVDHLAVPAWRAETPIELADTGSAASAQPGAR
jgi:hypothetical protein